MQEIPTTMLDNLDRAERLRLIDSADEWLAIRKLRNRMTHEYVPTPAELGDALNAAHHFIPALIDTLNAIVKAITGRFPALAPDGAARLAMTESLSSSRGPQACGDPRSGRVLPLSSSRAQRGDP